MRITWAGVRTAALAFVLFGPPFIFIGVALWQQGGWRGLGTVLLVTVAGTSAYAYVVTRLLRRSS